ncbi:MAG TPA: hypothetical protein VMY37_29905 [Thermoguttaceae bacterium]|nr:hypothetical protein [Thermoguttaceae bacterium]
MRFTLPQTGRMAGQLEGHPTWKARGKAGQTAASCWVPLPLQVAGVVAIVAAIGGLLGSRLLPSGEPVCKYERGTVPDGQVVRRSPPCILPRERQTPLADPGRVKRWLRVGETYVVRIKGGFAGPATYIEYRGNERAVRLAHAFETIQHRTIESNDGHRIVELDHFERVWAVTLLYDAKEPALDLGPPGEPLLDAFRGCEPHVGMRRVAPKAVAEAILRNPDRAVAANATTVALWHSDSLSGKTVRITYVDGVGVESIEPVGCSVAVVDRDYLFRAPFLWQGDMLAGNRNPNGTWTVDAAQLRGLTPPSMREIPRGKIVIEPTGDYRQGGTQRATLRIRRPPSGRPAEYPFPPVGTFQYDLGESRITAATLHWRAPRDCLTPLFPPTEPAFSRVVLETEPTIALHCCCKIRPPELPGKSCRQQGAEHEKASGDGQPASERWALGAGKWASIVPWDQQPLSPGARGDLLAGVAILLSLSVVLFRWGATTARQRPAALSLGVASATVACILVFASTVHGTLRLAEILPLTNVILLGNWLPPGAALLAGIVSGQRAVPPWRRAVFVLILLSLAWYTVLFHLLPQRVGATGRFENGVCVQTSSASCSPCCAVTALQCCDVEASEREMSRLCLTSKAGTSPLGLYRGLKLKTRDTARDVEIVRCSVEELCRANSYPVIMNPRIEPQTCIGQRDGAAPTWLPKVKHTVVILGVTPRGRVLIGDPSCGCVEWSLDDLRRRWSGVGLRLAERAGPLKNTTRG